MDVRVSADRAALAETAARFIVDEAQRAVASRGTFSIALAGGSTPKATYQRLAEDDLSAAMPWDHTTVFFGDERAVPPDHDDSNFRMADRALLSRAPIARERVHRMRGELADLDAEARDYAAILSRSIGDPPRIDLILLGIGDDGHTASIFPDVVESCRGPELVRCIVSAGKGPRLTLTLPALNAARRVVFLVAGETKAPVLRRILREAGGVPPYPSALVRPTDGELTFLVDAPAAADL